MKEVLTVRVENKLREDLDKEAELQGRTRSNLIQLALKKYLASQKESK
jgi:predicted transcriptional regulator